MNRVSTHGYVYILASEKTNYIKIGGTDYLPQKRCKEIDKMPAYSQYAPWHVVDFMGVDNWREVEHHLHYIYRDSLCRDIPNQKELFLIPASDVSLRLEELGPLLPTARPKIDRMFHNQAMSDYLVKLFSIAGCERWRAKEGVWTFTLFPGATHSGWARFFTLNIHSHEVAFCTRANDYQSNMLRMDSLILKHQRTLAWLRKRDGEIATGYYKTALPDSKSVSFRGDFADCLEFLELPGVHEGIATYWDRALEKYNHSIQKKYHNYQAVEEILKRIKV